MIILPWIAVGVLCWLSYKFGYSVGHHRGVMVAYDKLKKLYE